jgi:hypothetical protein
VDKGRREILRESYKPLIGNEYFFKRRFSYPLRWVRSQVLNRASNVHRYGMDPKVSAAAFGLLRPRMTKEGAVPPIADV